MLRYHFKKNETEDQLLVNLTEKRSKLEIRINNLNENLNNDSNQLSKIIKSEYYINIFEYVNHLKFRINSDSDCNKLNGFINEINLFLNGMQIRVDQINDDLNKLERINDKLNNCNLLDLLNEIEAQIAIIESSNSKNRINILNENNNKLIDHFNYLIKFETNRLKGEQNSENKKHDDLKEYLVKNSPKESNDFRNNLKETEITSNQSSIISSIDPLLHENNEENEKLFLINKNNKSEWLFVKDKSNFNDIVSNKSSIVSINENYMYEEKTPVCSIVEKILAKQTYSLESFKSKKDKVNLLNESVKSHDGNAILIVVLFLKTTLNRSEFYDIITSNQVALNHFKYYLDQINDNYELFELFKHENNHIELANLTYFKPILNQAKQNYDEKLGLINEFELKFNSKNSIFKNIYNGLVYKSVKQQIDLNKVQLEILTNKENFQKYEYTRQIPIHLIYGATVLNTIFFVLKYQENLKTNEVYEILNLRKKFQLLDREYSILLVKTKIELKKWLELDQLLENKGLFGFARKQSISYSTLVYIIVSLVDRVDVIKKYVNLIDDLEKRMNLAHSLRLIDVVIECFKLQNDKKGLIDYRDRSLNINSKEHFMINEALNDF